MRNLLTSLDYWIYIRKMLGDPRKYVVLIVEEEDEACRAYEQAINQTNPITVRPGRILEYTNGATLEICLRDVLHKRKNH